MITELLNGSHQLDTFDCGKPELDLWLRASANHAQSARTCRTFVWHDGDQMVRAYFSLAAHKIVRADIGKIGRGSPDEIPAILLARLALHKNQHGNGLGSVLLYDALSRAVAACEQVGARFAVVDAVDDGAAAFYAAHGFRRVPDDPHRLVRKISDIAKSFARNE